MYQDETGLVKLPAGSVLLIVKKVIDKIQREEQELFEKAAKKWIENIEQQNEKNSKGWRKLFFKLQQIPTIKDCTKMYYVNQRTRIIKNTLQEISNMCSEAMSINHDSQTWVYLSGWQMNAISEAQTLKIKTFTDVMFL